MLTRLAIGTLLVFSTFGASALAQNTNSSTTARPRTTSTQTNVNKAEDTPRDIAPVQPPRPKPAPAKAAASASPSVSTRSVTTTASAQTVSEAFNSLINGIRSADVDAVTSVYQNSPRLVLFNNNGTVTRGWEQLRLNRESSYKDVKDVKLEVSDIAITMLGRDGAVVTSQWKQSQIFRGTPETATGRMTLVFKRIGTQWKAIHLHTSPDKPDPSRVLPSEQTPTPTPTP